MSILLSVIIFSLLIILHELGHFLLARINKIEVIEFSLGMGPRLLSHQGKKTRYSLKLLPFGGSCEMLGEDEDIDKEGSFGSKSVWARISVVAAGPIFNFLTAFILSLILVSAFGYDRPVVSEVTKNYPAESAGIEAGDEIVNMNSWDIHLFREISLYNQTHPGEDVKVTYVRDGKEHSTTITPEKVDNAYMLGIVTNNTQTKPSFFGAFKYSIYTMKYWLRSAFESLRMLFTRKASINDMTGVVGIYKIIGSTYTEAVKVSTSAVVASMLNISILLSVSLGVMNLLPFPALDGGRIVFLIIEAITHKKVNQKVESTIHLIGLALLILLSLYVTFNDIFFH